jgi:hypothetical protein
VCAVRTAPAFGDRDETASRELLGVLAPASLVPPNGRFGSPVSGSTRHALSSCASSPGPSQPGVPV